MKNQELDSQSRSKEKSGFHLKNIDSSQMKVILSYMSSLKQAIEPVLDLPDDLFSLIRLYHLANSFKLDGLLIMIVVKICCCSNFLKYTNVRRVMLIHFADKSASQYARESGKMAIETIL